MTTIVTAGTTSQREALGAGAIPVGHVRLTCGDPALSLVVLLGSDPPKLTGGVGGWTVTGRPQAVGMTLWEGTEPYALSLSLMFDGWTGQASQEWALRQLLNVARGDRESPPGVLGVEGIPLPARRWVIESIDYGDAILATSGERLRQPITLALRQFVPPRFLKRRKSAFGSSTKVVVIRANKGDTPAKIAKRRRLKSWTVIRDLNKALKLKANTKLKTNQRIRVPSPKRQALGGGKDKPHKRRGK